MGRHQKLLRIILDGTADANVAFDDLRSLLRSLGFTEYVRGSHHVFRHARVVERINIQRDDSKAKVYQVRQLRAILARYGFDRASEE
jgi:virulence-associated protein VapD